MEKMAKRLKRALSIRRFMAKIAARPSAPAELVVSLKLMALMADRLHSVVKAH